MSIGEHPDLDVLLSATEGESGALRAVRPHLADCESCRDRVARLRGVLAAATEELLDLRPECLSADELALLPPGAEHDDPHLRDCPLCREELRLLFDFETEERLGFALSEGSFFRPEFLERGPAAVLYQRAGEPLEIALEEGRELEATVEGARVRLRCAGGELTARVEGKVGEGLVLVLSNEALEKRVTLGAGEVRLAVGRWRRVRVGPAGPDPSS